MNKTTIIIWVVVAIVLGVVIGKVGTYLRNYGSTDTNPAPAAAATNQPVSEEIAVPAGMSQAAQECAASPETSYYDGVCHVWDGQQWVTK